MITLDLKQFPDHRITNQKLVNPQILVHTMLAPIKRMSILIGICVVTL